MLGAVVVLVSGGIAVPSIAIAQTRSATSSVEVLRTSEDGPTAAFVSPSPGHVLGVRVWSDRSGSGRQEVDLRSSDGTVLARASVLVGSQVGWRTVAFTQAVPVEASATYQVGAQEVPNGSSYAAKDSSASATWHRGGSSIAESSLSGDPRRCTEDSSRFEVLFDRRGGISGRTAAGSGTTPSASPTRSTSAAPAPTATSTPTATATPTATPAPVTPSSAPRPSSQPAPAPVAPAPPAPAAGQPGPSNTGVPDGVSLSPSGGMTITQANTVIDAKAISGTVTVAAPNVVIRNSRISGNGTYGVLVRSGSLTIEDSTISGFENGIAGDGWTARRIEITAVSDDGAKLGDNVTMADSWIHDLTPAAGAHADGMQLQSGVVNVRVEHNTISAYNASTRQNGNSALFIAPDLGPSSPGPVVITGNWLDGGNYTVYVLDGDNGRYFIDSISVTNNRFGRNFEYGPLRVNVPATVSGNVFADNGSAVS